MIVLSCSSGSVIILQFRNGIRNALSRLSSSIFLYLYPQSSNNVVCFPPVFFIYPHYGKSPSPCGEGLYFRPNHLYTTYRSVVNFLCAYILASTNRSMCQVIVGTFSYLLMSVYFFYFQIILPALLSPTFISFSRRLFQRLFSMLSALHPEVAYDV